MSKKNSMQKWSQDMTENSDAMDLEGGVFKQRIAKKIADSLSNIPRKKAPGERRPRSSLRCRC